MGNEVCGGGGGAVDGAGAAIDVAADDDDDDDDGVGAATLAVAMTGGVGVPALLPLLVSLILISICKFTLSRIEMESSKLIIICVDLRKFCLEIVLLRKNTKKENERNLCGNLLLLSSSNSSSNLLLELSLNVIWC